MAQLNSGKYSISPNSGRLRKRVKKSSSEEKGIFKKRLDNFTYNSKVVFFILLIVIGLVLFFTYLKFQEEKEDTQRKYYLNPNKQYYDNLSKQKK